MYVIRMEKQMVSIIVPVYNAEKYLKKCVNSILKQNYPDFEILLINDGSTDRSGEICDIFESQDERVRVIHKKNEGSASARNLGIAQAKGEYIAFVDADDFISENYLSTLVGTLERTEADIVQCQFQKVNSYQGNIEPCTPQKDIKIYSNIDALEAFCGKKEYLSTAVLWNKLYKKELFRKLSFPIGRGIDDEYLICRIVYRAKRIAVISDVLYYYYMSPNSQMRSAPSLKKLDNIDALEGQIRFLRKVNQPRLANMLMYRYYSSIIDGYYYVKKNFPNETELQKKLKKKKRMFYVAILTKEVEIKDKCLLVFRNYFPRFFERMHTKLKKNEDTV